MPAIDIDRDAAHQAAQRELAKAIYPKESPIQRLHDWLDDLVYRVLHAGASMPGGWFTVSVLLILVAVGVGVTIHIARRTLRTSRGGDHPVFDGGQLSAAQHRATAEEFAAQGDWAAAIRHRLRAVARSLQDSGVISPMPGRTANELAHDAGVRLPHLASEMSQAANAFNDVTYGGRPGTPAAYRMIADLDEQLRSGSRAQVR
ncbi:DUF4129 domain-containing protein [Mycobacterium noviomagense]|uniref:Membrane protein n=1 Tax=Mycobacterium noviomagense TaxID=459858 RepID=A0A7I7PBU0_9MYCO|nr:DUF4129 domain-containing protein [Mycobacterium noviomagense]ORB11860.1 hypothetical protein BST37_17885 [Mycobacterium noviomagense]BBY06071.1 membrane protein [Mycobacterium noviomagense]